MCEQEIEIFSHTRWFFDGIFRDSVSGSDSKQFPIHLNPEAFHGKPSENLEKPNEKNFSYTVWVGLSDFISQIKYRSLRDWYFPDMIFTQTHRDIRYQRQKKEWKLSRFPFHEIFFSSTSRNRIIIIKQIFEIMCGSAERSRKLFTS